MLKKIVLVFAAVALAKAQIPSLGWCPEYVPMANFDMTKFLGVWYETERYFQLSEVVSRCVTTNYTKGLDGKLHVSNEVTNRFTGVKRILEGEIKPPASKSEEGKLLVRYTTVPFTPETRYSVLETDYKNYAVLWSCSGIGPVHAQNAWLMTRQRIPTVDVLQQAYGVLDKYKISKTFLLKTDQSDCAYEPPSPQSTGAYAPAPASAPAPAPAPAPAVAPAPAAPEIKEPVLPDAEAEKQATEGVHLRSAAVPQDAEATDETRDEEIAVETPDAPVKTISTASEPVEQSQVASAQPAEAVLPEEKPASGETNAQEAQLTAIAPETIPEVILKTAELAKETAAAPSPVSAEEPQLSVSPVAEESKTVEVVVPAENQPEPTAAILLPELEEPKIAEPSEATAEKLEVQAAPIEETKAPEEGIVKLAEEPKPAEIPLANEAAEESKPVEPLPEVESPAIAEAEKPVEVAPEIESPAPAVLLEDAMLTKSEPIVAMEEVKIVEVPAAQETPVDSILLKTLVVPEPEESPLVILEAEEPKKVPEGGEPVLKEQMVEMPEAILEPVVPEAAAEEPKTSEAKP